jgi:response regulator RpfG family c-di-GMP phosphodiesterase
MRKSPDGTPVDGEPAMPVAPSVLVVEDDASVRELLARWLHGLGYEVVSAGSADEALGLFLQAPTAVAVCDLRMPGRDGLWLAEQIRHISPDAAVVMATGVQDVGSAVTSLRHGVIDCLMKPFGRERLREAVARALEWHERAVRSRADGATEGAEQQRRHDGLVETFRTVQVESRAALDALLETLTAAEPLMLPHCRRVAERAVRAAAVHRLAGDEVETLELAALVHEVAKLTLPASVLHKPEPLSASERDLVRALPEANNTLLRQVPYLAAAAEVVRAHHERWDGGGYPQGLARYAIPRASRLLAVADTFDTMVHPRHSQPGLPENEAANELRRCRGTQFEPAAVDAFLQTLGLGPLTPPRP